MATNILQDDGSHVLKYTTTANVTAGSLILVGNVPGIALETATTGAVIGVAVGVLATVTKKAAASSNVTVGGYVSYTTTGGVNAVRGTTATGDKCIGYGYAVATTGATSATVRLINGAMTQIG